MDLQIARAKVEGSFLLGIWERDGWKKWEREGEEEKGREFMYCR